MNNVIIGLGNAGSQIIRLASESKFLEGEKFFAIDSVASNIDMDSVNNLNVIPIISDEKTGSGRNRRRGHAMYNYHKSIGSFDKMLKACEDSKYPIILVSSSSGGTGSGAIIGLAKTLIEDMGLDVIPIIIAPAMEDPDSYHMNTSDLLIELADIYDEDDEPGIKSYSIFRNPSTPNYTNINKAVVKSIETILGYHYDQTNMDSIDESDLATILGVPGRFISVYCEAPDITTLKRDITRAVLSGYQPAWNNQEAGDLTFVTAFSLSSMFAHDDFAEVFADIKERIGNNFEEFKNVADINSNETCYATAIIAGLPTIKIKEVDGEFKAAGTIADGIKKTVRPSFMGSKPKKPNSDKPDDTKKKKKKSSILEQYGL